MNTVGIGVRIALFLLEMIEGVQAKNKRWKKSLASRDLAKFCYATEIREGCTDIKERSNGL